MSAEQLFDRCEAEGCRHAERLAAAEAVCEAIAEHLRHGGTLPWPSIRHPYERWAEVWRDER